MELELGTKEKETKKLSAIELEVESYDISDVGQNKKKVIFNCKHPETEGTIQISKVKHEKEGKLVIEGTWLTLDADNKVSKFSALGKLMKIS